MAIISNIRCRFPRYLSALWEGRVFIIFILGYYDPGWGFITLLDFHTAWHIRRVTSFSINQIRIRIYVYGYTRHFFTRAVLVGYHNRPGLIAWLGRINCFLPVVLRTFWQIFVIADGALGTWRFTLVNRNLTGFWLVGVRLVWHDVVGYVNRFGCRVITVNYLGLTSLAVPNFTGIWFGRPNDLRSIWQTYRLSLGILQGHRAAIKAVTYFYFLTVSQGDRLSSRNGVVTLISLSHHIDGHWNVLA